MRIIVTPPRITVTPPTKPDGTPINWKRLLRRLTPPFVGMMLSLAGFIGSLYGLWLYATRIGF